MTAGTHHFATPHVAALEAEVAHAVVRQLVQIAILDAAVRTDQPLEQL
jgi:hypothetical protein